MERIKLPPRGVFFAVLLVLVTIAGWPPTAAAAVSCNQILKNAEKTGKPPTVTHIVDWGIITMTSALGSCREPIEVWQARHIKWIKVIKGAKAAPKIAVPKIAVPKTPKAGALIAPAPSKPAPESEPKPAAKAKPEPEPCNQRVENFWRQTAVSIQGATYYLSQAFTIDQDGDGVTDNIGFNFKARGKPDMVIRYFASPGQISARALPGIGIGNDELVARFCFGRVDFGDPPEEPSIAASSDSGGAFKMPDLAKQMERKKAGLPLDEPPPEPEQEKKKPLGLKFWIITASGSLLFIIGIAVVAIVTKPKWKHLLKRGGGDDDEDGEENEDEDEEEE